MIKMEKVDVVINDTCDWIHENLGRKDVSLVADMIEALAELISAREKTKKYGIRD